MAGNDTKSVKIFYAYSRKDKELRDQLANHLGRSYISSWYDREIQAGENWKEKIDEHLNSAQIILLLISSDFLASDYCSGIEMTRALERHDAGYARAIPIILRPVHWKDQPFSKLQVLPTNGKPVTSWLNRDEAFFDIAEGVRNIISDFLTKQYLIDAESYTASNQYEKALFTYENAITLLQGTNAHQDDLFSFLYEKKGDMLVHLQRYTEALNSYEKATLLSPRNTQLFVNMGRVLVLLGNFEKALDIYMQAIDQSGSDPLLYTSKGNILVRLQRYEEALAAYNKAISFDQTNPLYYKSKGDILLMLKQFDEALLSYDKAIHLEPKNFEYYVCKGDVLFKTRSYESALNAYEQALNLETQQAQIWRNKGKILFNLKRFTEALVAHEEAIHLEPNNPYLYKEKGDILFNLGRLEEALAAYEDAVRLNTEFGLAYLSKSVVLEELALQAYEKLKQRAIEAYEKAKQLGAAK